MFPTLLAAALALTSPAPTVDAPRLLESALVSPFAGAGGDAASQVDDGSVFWRVLGIAGMAPLGAALGAIASETRPLHQYEEPLILGGLILGAGLGYLLGAAADRGSDDAQTGITWLCGLETGTVAVAAAVVVVLIAVNGMPRLGH